MKSNGHISFTGMSIKDIDTACLFQIICFTEQVKHLQKFLLSRSLPLSELFSFLFYPMLQLNLHKDAREQEQENQQWTE